MGSSVALSGSDAYDLDRTTVRPVPGGLDVVVELCGDVGAPSLTSSSWAVQLTTALGQTLRVSMGDFEGLRRADVNLSQDDRFIAGERLAPDVSGRTITFALRRAKLTSGVVAALAPGSALSRPLTRTADQRTRVGTDTAFAATPGTQDEGSGPGSVLVG